VKLHDEGDGFLVMLSVSTVLNPIAWEIYLTLLFLPLAVVGRRLAQQSWPPRASVAFACLVFMLTALKVPRALVLGEGTGLNVSALQALVTALPLLWPLATAWAVVRSASLVRGSHSNGEKTNEPGPRPRSLRGSPSRNPSSPA
jgi:hypothetical protein